MAAPIALPPAVSVAPTDSPGIASPVADPTGATVDFAAMLAVQVESLQWPGIDAAAEAAAVTGTASDAAGVVPAAPDTNLALLLGSAVVPAADIALPRTNAPTDSAAAVSAAALLPTTAGKAGAPAVRLSTTVAPTAANTTNDAAESGFAAGLLKAAGNDRASAASDGGEQLPELVTGTRTAKFADSGIRVPATESPGGGGPQPLAPAGQHPAAVREAGLGTNGAPSAARVETPFGDARWSADFGQKIVWMARQDLQSVQISLNPPNLGPVDVSLSLGRDQATAVFSSPHAEVREALESALPRLREMLAGAGISLGQAQVGSQSQQQMADQSARAYNESLRYPDGSILAAATEARQLEAGRSGVIRGLVDTFA